MTKAELQILSSPFFERIRDLRFDKDAYAALTDALETLAVEWANAEVVNKEVAGMLFILPPMVRGTADTLARHADSLRAQEGEDLRRIADDLESLVFQCVVENPAPSHD